MTPLTVTVTQDSDYYNLFEYLVAVSKKHKVYDFGHNVSDVFYVRVWTHDDLFQITKIKCNDIQCYVVPYYSHIFPQPESYIKVEKCGTNLVVTRYTDETLIISPSNDICKHYLSCN